MSISDFLYDENEYFEKNIFPGVTVGVVTNIDDPQSLGRIKVKLIARDTSEYETDYIRVMTAMTGKEWGSFFLPEIGDEVIVAFGGGDMSRPYVLGSLWNSNYKPPHKIENSKNDIREIKTKSGHQLIFNDEKDKESIVINTPKGLTLKLDDQKEVIELKDKDGKNILKIDSKNGIINAEAEKSIKFKTGNASIELDGSSNSIVIEGKQSLTLKSQQISIEAKGSVQLKATSNVNIKSDGPLNLKGAVIKAN